MLPEIPTTAVLDRCPHCEYSSEDRSDFPIIDAVASSADIHQYPECEEKLVLL